MTGAMAVTMMGTILKAINYIKDFLKKEDNKNKLLSFKDNQLNDAVKVIVMGDVNAPITVIEKGDKLYFGLESNTEWIKEKLDKGGESEIVDAKFQDEYIEYTEFNKLTKYPFDFVKILGSKYKSLIKASQYVKKLYDEGDRDIAAKRKEELAIRYGSEGRQFCNLYTEGYITDALQYINDSGLRDKSAIESLLDNIVRHRGVLFIHLNTDIDNTVSKICTFIGDNLNYIAIHGLGNNIEKVKKIKNKIQKEAENLEYTIKEKHTKGSETENNVAKYGVFIFNEGGERVYNEFFNGSFKGFF